MAHTITQSAIVGTRSQGGGRAYVSERHTWDDATTTDVTYLADAGQDTAAIMAARATALVADRTAGETIAANRTLADSVRAKLVAFLSGLSDNAIRTQLGLTVPELTLLRTFDIRLLAGRLDL